MESIKLDIPIPQERTNELCNKYIQNSLLNKKTVDQSELSELSCNELCMLILNTDWFIEKTGNAANKEIAESNKNAFLNAIKMHLFSEKVYLIFSELTQLPFLLGSKFALIYTDNKKAEEVALHFSGLFTENPIKCVVKEYSATDEMCELFAVCGIHKFLVDGVNRVFDLCEIYAPIYEDYGNICPELSFLMQQYTQIVYSNGYGLDSKERFGEIKDELIKRLKTSKLLMATDICNLDDSISEKITLNIPLITKKDGSKWQPLFTDQLAINEYFKSSNQASLSGETVFSVYQNIKDDNSVSGIVINPHREQMELDRNMIDNTILRGCNALNRLNSSECFYVIYFCVSGLELPYISRYASIYIFSNEKYAENTLLNLKGEKFIKKFAADDFPQFMNYCLKNGIRKLNYNFDSDDYPAVIDIEDYFSDNKKYCGAVINQLIIRLHEMTKNVNSGLKEYESMKATITSALSHEILKTPFLVPIIYAGENENTPVEDYILHITDYAAKYFTNQYLQDIFNNNSKYIVLSPDIVNKRVADSLLFYGGEKYHFATESDKTAISQTMHIRTVQNGILNKIPAFTDFETLFNVFGEKVRVAVFSFDDLVMMAKSNVVGNASFGNVSGIVINPSGTVWELDQSDIATVLAERNEPIKFYTEDQTSQTGRQLHKIKNTNKKCKSSLLFGVIGFVTGFVFLGILAAIYGFIGLKQIKSTNEKGKGMAIAGIITGLFDILLLSTIVLAFILNL